MLNRETKKILLLSPDISRPVFNQNGKLKTDRFFPPLGLGYLSAILKMKDYQVKVIDCLDKSLPDLKKEIIVFGPQVIGISCFTEHRGGSLRLARLVKKINKKILVVFGGNHATFMYEQILSFYPEVDFCVLGEGEKTFIDLLENFFRKSRQNYEKIPGLAFRKEEKIVVTKPRHFIEDLDKIPFPDREWIDYSVYQLLQPEIRKLKLASLITTRGCPYGCKFCSTSQFWGLRTRFRSVENVMAEIDFLWKKGFRALNFVDDTFTLNQKRAQEICQKIIERKYNLLWSCTTRAGMVSPKTARLLRKAGCFSVSIGIETLSPKIIQNIGKRIKISQARETFSNLRKAGIKSGCLLMVGNMGEDKESIKETIKNLKKVKPDSIYTNLTQIYPATPFYEVAKERGFINDDYWLRENLASPIYLAENSLAQLMKFEKMIWESFFWQKRDFLRWFSRKSGLGSKIWPIVGAIKRIRG